MHYLIAKNSFPTRLLDVTENHLVALYFTCQDLSKNGELIAFEEINNSIKFEDSGIVHILAALPFVDKEDKEEIKLKYSSLTEEDKEEKTDSSKEINDILLPKIRGIISNFKPNIVPKDLFSDVVFIGRKNNERIVNQQGAFILCGLYEESVEELSDRLAKKTLRYGAENKKRIVYMIPKNKKESILQELEGMGISERFVYPELVSFSKWASELIG